MIYVTLTRWHNPEDIENGYNAYPVCVECQYLNPFLIAGSLDNSVDVDAGYVDVLFSKGSNVHHLFHLHRDAE